MAQLPPVKAGVSANLRARDDAETSLSPDDIHQAAQNLRLPVGVGHATFEIPSPVHRHIASGASGPDLYQDPNAPVPDDQLAALLAELAQDPSAASFDLPDFDLPDFTSKLETFSEAHLQHAIPENVLVSPCAGQQPASSPDHLSARSGSSASSWAILTPSSQSNSAGTRESLDLQPFRPAPEELRELSWQPPNSGPCSRTWNIPPKRRGKKRSLQPVIKRQLVENGTGQAGARRRGRFQDEAQRQQTATTRKNKGCIRCRMLRNRCLPDPDDPAGDCRNCKNLSRPTISSIPCIRRIITDSFLFREQETPYQLFSRRWQSMDLVDITNWASTEIKSIEISQVFLDAPYTVQVREFIPVEGDMLEEKWTSGTIVHSHQIPRYALCDMKKTANTLESFIHLNIGTYISGAVGNLDTLLWETYIFAFKFTREAQTNDEKELLAACFRLWVGCRKTSNPHHLYGQDKLGGKVVRDPGSPFNNVVPMPVIMIAQMECIMYTRVLRPLRKRVLDLLSKLVNENKPRFWMTIYLTTFMLLHSCSMLTRRDGEVARQYNLETQYANPRSIAGLHHGADVLLAHFHYLNKGVVPFALPPTPEGRKTLAKAAELSDRHIAFIHRTSELVKNEERASTMAQIRGGQVCGHDLYWVSQLFEEKWKPNLAG